MSEQNTPIENSSIAHAAAGNLAFLLSVVRCGETLSEAEEVNVRKVIDGLGELERADAADRDRALAKYAGTWKTQAEFFPPYFRNVVDALRKLLYDDQLTVEDLDDVVIVVKLRAARDAAEKARRS